MRTQRGRLIKRLVHIPIKTELGKLGNEEVKFDGDDLVIGRVKYEGTRGLWELIVSNKPSEQNYDDGDYATYSEIMVNTNTMRRDNDPNNPYPKSSKSWKWTNVVKDIWDNRKTYEGQEQNLL